MAATWPTAIGGSHDEDLINPKRVGRCQPAITGYSDDGTSNLIDLSPTRGMVRRQRQDSADLDRIA